MAAAVDPLAGAGTPYPAPPPDLAPDELRAWQDGGPAAVAALRSANPYPDQTAQTTTLPDIVGRMPAMGSDLPYDARTNPQGFRLPADFGRVLSPGGAMEPPRRPAAEAPPPAPAPAPAPAEAVGPDLKPKLPTIESTGNEADDAKLAEFLRTGVPPYQQQAQPAPAAAATPAQTEIPGVVPLPPLPKGYRPMYNAMDVENRAYQASLGGQYSSGEAEYWKKISDRINGGEMLYGNPDDPKAIPFWRPYEKGPKDPMMQAIGTAAGAAGTGHGTLFTTPQDIQIGNQTFKGAPANIAQWLVANKIGQLVGPQPAGAPAPLQTAPVTPAAPPAPPVNLPAVPNAGVPMPTGGVMGAGGGTAAPPPAGPAPGAPAAPAPGAAAAPAAPAGPKPLEVTGTPVPPLGMEAVMQRLDANASEAKAAQGEIAALQAMRDMMDPNNPNGGLKTGWLGEERAQLSRMMTPFIGADGAAQLTGMGAVPADVFQKNALQLYTQGVRAMGAREPGSVIGLFSRNYPNLETQPQAFDLMSNILTQRAQRSLDRRAYLVNQTGGGAQGLPALEQAELAFDQQHPEVAYMHAGEAMTPGFHGNAWKSALDKDGNMTALGQSIYDAIPAGSVYFGPQGQRKMKPAAS